MHNLLVPALLLVVAPAVALAVRSGFTKSRAGLATVCVAVFAVTMVALPYRGLDFSIIKRISMLVAAAAALLLYLRHLRVAWACKPRIYYAALALTALVGVSSYLNFFSFHGDRTFLHLHDVAHYYLGSKYFAELGYTDLYTAMLRAEAELYDDHFKAIEARDLKTNELVHIRTLLVSSDPVKAAFTPERWEAFRTDTAFFREAAGPLYGNILRDHGFNPTPLWALIGGTLANLVPAGSHSGILALSLLDPLLLVATFAAVAWAFGGATAVLALVLFSVLFGATFGWIGGAFLRYLWFAAAVGGVCAVERRRPAAAGALFALATLLRLFPVALIAAFAFRWIAPLFRRDRPPAMETRLLGSFALTAVLLTGATALAPGGLGGWQAFGANIEMHHATVAPNLVGVAVAAAYRGDRGEVTRKEFVEIQRERQTVHRLVVLTVFAAAVILVAGLSVGTDAVGAAALGIWLLLTGLNLAAYYYTVLVLLVLAHRKSPARLSLVFACEAAMYVLVLFESSESLLHVYRSVLLLYLMIALYFEPITSLARHITGRRLDGAETTS